MTYNTPGYTTIFHQKSQYFVRTSSISIYLFTSHLPPICVKIFFRFLKSVRKKNRYKILHRNRLLFYTAVGAWKRRSRTGAAGIVIKYENRHQISQNRIYRIADS